MLTRKQFIISILTFFIGAIFQKDTSKAKVKNKGVYDPANKEIHYAWDLGKDDTCRAFIRNSHKGRHVNGMIFLTDIERRR